MHLINPENKPKTVPCRKSFRSCYGCCRGLVCNGNSSTHYCDREKMSSFTIQVSLWHYNHKFLWCQIKLLPPNVILLFSDSLGHDALTFSIHSLSDSCI